MARKWNRLMLEFMKEKNSIIKAWASGIAILNDDDLAELSTWSEYKSKKFLVNIVAWHDSRICPWCTLSPKRGNNCAKCSYGKRHGECNDEGSTYMNILESLTGYAITSIIAIKRLVSEYQMITDDAIRKGHKTQ
jgi:hypothetical protein